MEKIQAFFHKRKRATAFFLAGTITTVSFLPRIVNAYNLDDGWYSTLETTCAWEDDSEAMQVNRDKYGGQYTLTAWPAIIRESTK